MTATEPPGWWKSKTTAHHSLLPPEIWFSIFDHATAVPQALDTHLRDPFDLPPPLSGRQVQQKIFDSLATKRFLVRVCKDWYQLASRFLYREIIIGRGHTLVSLRSTLLESHRRAEESATQAEGTKFTPSLGQYTLRFEIATRILPDLKDATVISELETLVDILRCLPNLQIFIMAEGGGPYHAIKFHVPQGVLSPLGSHCGQSLRVIRWDRYPYPTAPQWSQLLQTTPNLRILRFPTLGNRGRLQAGSPLLNLMSLEGADSSDALLGTAFPNQIYPSLYYLSISPFLPPTFLLNSYGPQLTFITITHHISNETLDLLSTACPNLTKLVIHFSSPPNFPSRFPKTITHLGLRCNIGNGNIYDTDARAVFEGLESIEVPNLQVVRFLDRRCIEFVRHHQLPIFAWGVDLLAETRFMIEDCDGVPIRP
ncbi:hypothetical protein JAAARDRAFT_34617 [Jaapia argillacea MUCL 33604]|uniref:F-box domain-containing protein n=1 Tax=Jaapia argillacea MUCL 33604 TaxID=933084 RepID=A0A067PVJ9_9AGAM|nr:hypothetical protein JAAARDRAFT_34617 [Jaapia argillacea MUCL 33604]